MSGGHFDFHFYQLEELANNIERDFINDGKYIGEDFTGKEIKYDRIGDATDDERKIILAEIKSLVSDLRSCYKRAYELDYYMSGDTGATSYLERLKE